MQITNKVKNVDYSNTRQSAKVTGGSNSKVQTSTGKGGGSTPAAMFKNSTKDDYDTSTLNPLQKRVLSLQEQITDINSDDKMESETKNNLLNSLQEELASVQDEMLKQQEDTLAIKTDNKDLEYRKHVYKDGCDGCIDYTNPDYYEDQDFKDLVAECRKEGYTDEQIYGFTHIVTAPELEMGAHISKIKDMVKDVCDKYGFDYYERRGHEPDMEAILKKNGKKAYEALNQVFSDFERTLWQQGSKDREGFSSFQRKLGEQGLQNGQDVSSSHNGGFSGTIWEVLIPPSADPNKSRDPLSFIK